jgi:porin
VHQTYEAVLEFDYRLQVTKFAYVQPFLQYLIRPNGTGLVENATVLGLQMGVI